MSSDVVVSPKPESLSVGQGAWLLASLIPAALILSLFALVFYAAPEFDDFCYFHFYSQSGFLHTVVERYFDWQGRVFLLASIQLPIVIAKNFGTTIFFAYSLTLAGLMVAFVAGCSVAIARALPDLPRLLTAFLSLAFVSAIFGATSDIHDMLYWVAALACYVPPGMFATLVMAECVRALDRGTIFSWPMTGALAVATLLASLCNEYTAPWFMAIVAGSFIGRLYFGQRMQVGHHAVLGIVALAGAAIVLLAPGNNLRLGLSGGVRIHDIGYLAPRAMNYALLDLGRFLTSPAVIGWALIVAIVTLVMPSKPSRANMQVLALGVVAVCFASGYFEYLTAHLSTGMRLFERAVNQALILLFFGLTLTVSLLVRAYRESIVRRLPAIPATTSLPALLGVIAAVSLALSPTVQRLYSERNMFLPFWEESVARDQTLMMTSASSVVVHQHKWAPSILLGSDVDVDTSCMGLYYGKTAIIPAGP